MISNIIHIVGIRGYRWFIVIWLEWLLIHRFVSVSRDTRTVEMHPVYRFVTKIVIIEGLINKSGRVFIRMNIRYTTNRNWSVRKAQLIFRSHFSHQFWSTHKVENNILKSNFLIFRTVMSTSTTLKSLSCFHHPKRRQVELKRSDSHFKETRCFRYRAMWWSTWPGNRLAR